MTSSVLHGDALTMLQEMPDACFHTSTSSPPYFSPIEGLRNYEIEPIVWPDGIECVLGQEAAQQCGRDYVGIEISAKYCGYSHQRLKENK